MCLAAKPRGCQTKNLQGSGRPASAAHGREGEAAGRGMKHRCGRERAVHESVVACITGYRRGQQGSASAAATLQREVQCWSLCRGEGLDKERRVIGRRCCSAVVAGCLLGCPEGKLQPAAPGNHQGAQRAQKQSASLGAGDYHICNGGTSGASVGVAQDPHICTRNIVGLPNCSSRVREGQAERGGWGAEDAREGP